MMQLFSCKPYVKLSIIIIRIRLSFIIEQDHTMSFIDTTGLSSLWAKIKNYLREEIASPENLIPTSRFSINDFAYSTIPSSYTSGNYIYFTDYWRFSCNKNISSFAISVDEANGGVTISGSVSSAATITLDLKGYAGNCISTKGDYTLHIGMKTNTGSVDCSIDPDSSKPSSATSLYTTGEVILSAGNSGKGTICFNAPGVANTPVDVAPVIKVKSSGSFSITVTGVALYGGKLPNTPIRHSRDSLAGCTRHGYREIHQVMGDAQINAWKNYSNDLFGSQHYDVTMHAIKLLDVHELNNTNTGSSHVFRISGRITLFVEGSSRFYDCSFVAVVEGSGSSISIGSSDVNIFKNNIGALSWQAPSFSVSGSKVLITFDSSSTYIKGDCMLHMEYTLGTPNNMFGRGLFSFPSITV